MMWWSVSPRSRPTTDAGSGRRRTPSSWACTPRRRYRGDTARALADTKGWLADGWRTVYVTEAHGPAARTVEVLGGEGIAARLDADLRRDRPVRRPCRAAARLDYGFVDPALKLAVLTETDLSGQKAAGKDGAGCRPGAARPIDPLTLEAGDYIVHEQHGVGRYVEMVQRTVQGATREYLLVEYAPAKRGQPGDRLFVPTDQLEQVTKYVGGEAPTLHRLGGADWTKTKARAKKAVKEIAAELIKLYSARMAAPGHAFGPDTPWQRELEDAFPYVETPDQLATIDEVKEDMEKTVPMDRLICGDVGYGKTEIAVRAAFKAVQDGKQVAVLVPTTLLVQQHFGTFSERYSPVPGQRPGAVPVPDRHGGEGGPGGPAGRLGRHRHRHPPAVLLRDQVQGPGPGHRRRGAALRRRAQGAAEEAPRQRRRADACPRPRSRAPWRWRSPASARCRRSPPRRRSATRC